ncbi:hypothetical protein G7046_g3204 [Stylonectria norvegica]|nr:hypothetical protein G7046_g3204 [Stylonectria norvegica]
MWRPTAIGVEGKCLGMYSNETYKMLAVFPKMPAAERLSLLDLLKKIFDYDAAKRIAAADLSSTLSFETGAEKAYEGLLSRFLVNQRSQGPVDCYFQGQDIQETFSVLRHLCEHCLTAQIVPQLANLSKLERIRMSKGDSSLVSLLAGFLCGSGRANRLLLAAGKAAASEEASEAEDGAEIGHAGRVEDPFLNTALSRLARDLALAPYLLCTNQGDYQTDNTSRSYVMPLFNTTDLPEPTELHHDARYRPAARRHSA